MEMEKAVMEFYINMQAVMVMMLSTTSAQVILYKLPAQNIQLLKVAVI